MDMPSLECVRRRPAAGALSVDRDSVAGLRIRLAIASALLALTALAPGSPAAASTEDFTFSSFDADYYLDRGGGGNATLRVVETLVAEFGDFDQNHGIERAIPTDYGEVALDPAVVAVTNADGAPVQYKRTDEYGFATLRIGDPDTWVHGTQTYLIEYTLRNVVRSFDDTAADEFYWDINGTGWGQTIGFDQTTFVEPPLLRDHWGFTVVPWVLLALFAAALAWAFSLRLFIWRDARGRGIIVPHHAPR